MLQPLPLLADLVLNSVFAALLTRVFLCVFVGNLLLIVAKGIDRLPPLILASILRHDFLRLVGIANNRATDVRLLHSVPDVGLGRANRRLSLQAFAHADHINGFSYPVVVLRARHGRI